ncbi:hypothetical protein [Neptunomonas sp.]|uniref:hypothetical protein n=1 Tax=Neptunomonas TaxID=75687 RepID=UPI003518C0B2
MTIMKEFPAAPIHSIPTSDATRKALIVLSDGKPHPKIVFIEAIGDDPRWVFQALGSETHGYWKIDNVSTGGKGVYQLDPRHLSDCPQADAAARLERKRQLSERSLKQAQRETARLPRAIDTALKLRCEDQQGFDFNNTESGPSAANDKGHNLAGNSLDPDQDSISIVASNPNLQKGVQHAD